MFDIGFLELIIIAVVGLVVIGPERLPGVARNVGKWVGRTRRFVTQVKSDIDREMKQEDLRKALERDAGLDELKQIMNSDRFTIEEEDKPDYLVKAIGDDDVDTGKEESSAVSSDDSKTTHHTDAPDNEQEKP
ncbi:Sec-independent protein translocase protein TatB [Thiohalophilus sp.]|uniref:Sec-independent protein translocase protein TatB n=1 Tax=Thiohalophilus sp. TaxID=3028392 RepID=UPI003974C1E3